jgi:hypothetical protein
MTRASNQGWHKREPMVPLSTRLDPVTLEAIRLMPISLKELLSLVPMEALARIVLRVLDGPVYAEMPPDEAMAEAVSRLSLELGERGWNQPMVEAWYRSQGKVAGGLN